MPYGHGCGPASVYIHMIWSPAHRRKKVADPWSGAYAIGQSQCVIHVVNSGLWFAQSLRLRLNLNKSLQHLIPEAAERLVRYSKQHTALQTMYRSISLKRVTCTENRNNLKIYIFTFLTSGNCFHDLCKLDQSRHYD